MDDQARFILTLIFLGLTFGVCATGVTVYKRASDALGLIARGRGSAIALRMRLGMACHALAWALLFAGFQPAVQPGPVARAIIVLSGMALELTSGVLLVYGWGLLHQVLLETTVVRRRIRDNVDQEQVSVHVAEPPPS